uniref:Uncharacterized protein n=1 Tax=Candidatus Enterococcus clewellii TaxID=1834193 RepID=A0A242K4F9_9ENTE|nr:hypothetical protein A5888_002424 [Enterococcus sp. 9E7_DIV0242]
MKGLLKNSNLYLVIAFIIMGILFYSSSQTYDCLLYTSRCV